MFSERAITMILPIYRKLRIDGFETRGQYLLDLQLASNFAGIAIANALPSAAHAMSYPFANKFHRPHGEACYVFLNATLQKYLRDVESGKLSEERVKTWRGMMEIIARGLDMAGAPDKELLQALDELLYFILPRKTLKEYGAQPEDCVEFGRHCYEQQQRLMTCAFSEFSEQELIEAYQSVYE